MDIKYMDMEIYGRTLQPCPIFPHTESLDSLGRSPHSPSI